ncbi:Clavaminate synthase isoform B, partial [Micractinium conductrix]
SLQLAVSMVNDIVRGTFKGFAMLRQIALSTSQPGMPGFGQPQPVYVQGYGFVPPTRCCAAARHRPADASHDAAARRRGGGLAGGLTPEAIAALLGQQQGAGGMQGNMGAPGGSQGSGRASPATALARANPPYHAPPLSDTGSPLGRYGAVGSPSSQGAGSIGAASIGAAAEEALAAKMASAAISPGAGPTSMQPASAVSVQLSSGEMLPPGWAKVTDGQGLVYYWNHATQESSLTRPTAQGQAAMPTRGSLHYDPYSNLLCVARGSKTVLLLPPSAAPALAAQPLTAESANHSPADLSALDLRRFPGLQAVLPQVRRFQLAAGDALFIPEGWWHQVGACAAVALLAAGYPNSSNGRLSAGLETDIPLTPTSPGGPAAPRRRRLHLARAVLAAAIFALLLLTLTALLAATVQRCRREGGAGCLIPQALVAQPWGGSGSSLWPPKKRVSRVAFGSCTAHDVQAQPIWEEGIIPSEPDAWVWLGDMFYADQPPFECTLANSNASVCQCTPTYIRIPPWMCAAGDADNAREKMVAQVQQPGYQAFLQYACPGFDAPGSGGPGGGGGGALPPGAAVTVPAGDDLSVCPRPILGTYDDHDYSISNFNRRLPNKHSMKQIFLDAIGVPTDSPRRAAQQGIEWAYKLNPGTAQEVDLVLLDERYERAPLPCEIRDDWCCKGGATGKEGSCCKADRSIYSGWCTEKANHKDPLWQEACNVSSPLFGQQPLYNSGGILGPSDVEDARQTEERSSFCELLGAPQRRWLERALGGRTAAVKVVASGSVLFGNSGLEENSQANGWSGRCGGDDWDCYRPARLNLLHMLQRHAHGACVVVITGDYHFSDIKAAYPGSGKPYSAAYETEGWSTPIYQAGSDGGRKVMASGMTNSTARPNAPCEGYRRDTTGMRIAGECGFVKVPAFGMLQFDWAARTLSMQIRGGEGAAGGTVLQQLTISLDTCRPV